MASFDTRPRPAIVFTALACLGAGLAGCSSTPGDGQDSNSTTTINSTSGYTSGGANNHGIGVGAPGGVSGTGAEGGQGKGTAVPGGGAATGAPGGPGSTPGRPAAGAGGASAGGGNGSANGGGSPG